MMVVASCKPTAAYFSATSDTNLYTYMYEFESENRPSRRLAFLHAIGNQQAASYTESYKD